MAFFAIDVIYRGSLGRKGSLATEVSAASVYCIIHLRPNPAVAPSIAANLVLDRLTRATANRYLV